MNLVFLFIGIIAGGAIVWLLVKIKKNSGADSGEYDALKQSFDAMRIEKRILEERIADLKKTSEELSKDLEKERSLNIGLSKSNASAETTIVNLNEKLTTQKQEIENLYEKLNVNFKNIANEILEEKSKKFTEQNHERLSEILKPLGERIKEFEKKVDDTYDKESKQRFSLQEEVKKLSELNQKMSQEAHNLTTALKGQSKTQGNWGEIILESILEKSGLVKDREYFVQPSYTSDEGKRLQPDVVVNYPGERYIVIDSKVSLVAYERYSSLESEPDRELAFREHIVSLKNHVNELSSKNYQNIYQLRSLDFVMMFLPVEPAYLIAIQRDRELWSYAYERKVLLISPTNLIAALKMIASLWQQEYQSRNAIEIAEQSGALYDKFVAFVEDMIEVGKKIEGAQTNYKSAMNKLYEGKGNLVKRAEDIKKMGAKTKKSLPQSLIDRAVE